MQKSWHKAAYLIWLISVSKCFTKNIPIMADPTAPRSSCMSDCHQLEFRIDRVLWYPCCIVNEWKVRRVLSSHLVCFVFVLALSAENPRMLEVLRLLISLSPEAFIRPLKEIKSATSRIQGGLGLLHPTCFNIRLCIRITGNMLIKLGGSAKIKDSTNNLKNLVTSRWRLHSYGVECN